MIVVIILFFLFLLDSLVSIIIVQKEKNDAKKQAALEIKKKLARQIETLSKGLIFCKIYAKKLFTNAKFYGIIVYVNQLKQ